MALVQWHPTRPWRPFQQSWSPVEGMESLRAELERIVDAYFGNTPPSSGRASLWSPRVDLLEHDRAFVLLADLPGMKPEDIDIAVQDHLLTLQGKRAFEHVAPTGNGNDGSHYSERAQGAFCRRFTLGTAVDAEHITATYKDGVLEVHIPKTAAAQPKRIAVQSAA
jgi:HSP20 family protein